MAKALAALLGRESDKLLLHAIESFEAVTGTESVDVVLISDIWRKSHKVIKSLQLDSSDSTAKEIYQALRSCNNQALLKGCGYVGVLLDGEIVSFNQKDIDYDKERSSDFEHRSLRFMRQALLNEIEARYAATSVSSERLAELMNWLRQRV